MIVGEAPGFKEAQVGRPFVGRSGRLLGVALQACGVQRADVYITNVVKHVPIDSDGKIRRPYKVEIESWQLLLEHEVLATAPAAILVLGRTAADEFCFERGVPFGVRENNIFTAWHPSFVLRQGAEGNEVIYSDWLEQLLPWAEAIQ